MIAVEDLTMTYKSGRGVFDLAFSVKEGEVFGYLGPNGAGKTTTIRVLMGFTNADKGTCTINGLDCRTQAHEIQEFTGYLPGETAFFDEMKGNEFLHFLHEMRRSKDKARLDSLLERFQLDPSIRIRRMSKGNRQKLAIMAAFMHDPSVYIMDEPTSGLDPLMQKVFIELILEEKARGKTILMSSHNFEEIYRTSDRAGVIREGQLVAVEDVHSLKESQRKVYLVTVGSSEDVDILKASGLETVRIDGNNVEVAVTSNYQEFMETLGQCRILGLDVVSQSLEEVFMKYYGQEVG